MSGWPEKEAIKGVISTERTFAVANVAILTQLFTVEQKHVSTSVYEQSQPAVEAGYRRDNIWTPSHNFVGLYLRN